MGISIVTLGAVVGVWLVAGFHPDADDELNVALGSVALGYGTWAFLAHGASQITALGLFNYAFAIFIGVGGLSEGVNPGRVTAPGYVSAAITLAITVQLLVNLAAWRRASPATGNDVTMPSLRDARIVTWVGAIAIAGMFAAQRTGIPYADSPVGDGSVFTAVTLFAAGLLFRVDTRPVSPRLVYILGAFGLYVTVFHQGTGRLRLVALACVIGLLLTARFPHRAVKWATVAATPLAIWWLAQDRLELQESLQPGASEGRTGLESMLSPIRVFAQIVEAIDLREVTPAWGSTFLSVPFTVLPQNLQPEWVPQALGYELVGLVAPEREGSGYSVVATVYGEWYWNFGWIGLMLAVPVLAWLFGTLDGYFRRAMVALATGPQALLMTAFWAMLAGGIADLAWSGTHTWVVRQLTRLGLLAIAATIMWLASRPRRHAWSPRGVNAGPTWVGSQNA
ncbi:oligosaccharide repeat unit polymerase [Blastococcus sp. KM273128]|uniref:hypothetical protein n=1 Tax=Blastococcus sp. KM273128 TaxID=2570314 RepID=UPI001F2714C8|nr:hypothetical protein [Blastococcus sp. KM273128]MCF6745200.1 oligosaccharide repeat unit polymerase [Blastococcus sp. KM273128]